MPKRPAPQPPDAAPEVGALTWNVYHGRDFPPDPGLFTTRSRLLRVTERNATHVQVNRNLSARFCGLIAGASWDVALLQECPPRWAARLAAACGAEVFRSLTSRNSCPRLRGALARVNPDLIGSDEGGSNLVAVRPKRVGRIVKRRELVIAPGPRPERRTMAFVRTAGGLCVANLHASAGAPLRATAEREVWDAARIALRWAANSPLIFGGDLNLRPRESPIYDRLASELGLMGPTAPGSLDHLLVSGLETAVPPSAWAPERREVSEAGLAIRLSDHAPVGAVFRPPGGASTPSGAPG